MQATLDKPIPATPVTPPAVLPSALQIELWSRVLARLEAGEAMVTTADFEGAIAAEYDRLTGQPLDEVRRHSLRRSIEALHRQHPETYLAYGVNNAVQQAFAGAVDRCNWDRDDVQHTGYRVLRRFLRSGGIRQLLDDMRLRPDCVDAPRTVSRLLDHLPRPVRASPEPLADRPAPPPPLAATAGRPQAPTQVAAQVSPTPRPPVDFDPELSQAAAAAGLEPDALSARVEEQEGLRLVLAERQMGRLPESLAAFVQDRVLTDEEAQQARALHEIDALAADGQLPAEEVESRLELVLGASDRRELDEKVRKAVDGTVAYLQVFEALKRIPQSYDPLLQLLAEHWVHVVEADRGDRTVLLGALTESDAMLDLAMALMDLKDHEVRLLTLRLPPYNRVAPRKLQPIHHLTLEPAFLDGWRRRSVDDLAQTFRSADALERARPAADLLSLIHLIDHVIQPTAFRQKLRLLEVNRLLQRARPRLEALYGKHEPREARRQAERFLAHRVGRRFDEATKAEQLAAHRRGQGLLLTIEDRVATDRDDGAQQVEAALRAAEVEEAAAIPREESELSEDEVRQGAQMARVEVRIAGDQKRVPTKIMPDPDDPEHWVMARRDPETGQLVPQVRQGKRRYVARGGDGSWKAA
jgi:hypothetical protein